MTPLEITLLILVAILLIIFIAFWLVLFLVLLRVKAFLDSISNIAKGTKYLAKGIKSPISTFAVTLAEILRRQGKTKGKGPIKIKVNSKDS